MSTYFITTFYKFMKLEDLPQIQQELEETADSLALRGLIILGAEGFNSTVAAPNEEALQTFKSWIQSRFQAPDLLFKNSFAQSAPFRRFKVKVRQEIVTLGVPDLMPETGNNHHLTPSQWNQVLTEESDFLLIDTRNWYETQMGTFKGAINPGIEKFTDFPRWLESQNYPKNKKMLIFCTGGIRCEKGILDLQRSGYDNVYQLEGGILNYIEERPNEQFTGECFVFDHRVAVNQNLQPSTVYKLCPHCGQPAATPISCKRCDTKSLICHDCAEKVEIKETCSKNCAHHWALHPDRKGANQIQPFELEKSSPLR